MTSRPLAVINAAGSGRRMGKNLPKCLIPILGNPLVFWQLQTLAAFEQVVVVIGYRAEEVRRTVQAFRPDARFVLNPDYESTGTASSLSLGAAEHRGAVLSLDGDLLVHPHDLTRLATAPEPCIGVCPIQSLSPVYVELEASEDLLTAKEFHRDQNRLLQHFAQEWTGLVMYDTRQHSLTGRGHVFEMIRPLLPCAAVSVRCREIDYPEEIAAMENWLASLMAEGMFHE